jgi:hypothetical protein
MRIIMKKFKVQVYWKMGSAIEVEANSITEAFEKAKEYNGLPRGEYVCDSFEVDEEVSDMMNGQDK